MQPRADKFEQSSLPNYLSSFKERKKQSLGKWTLDGGITVNEEIGIASDVVKVKGEDLETPAY